MNVKPLFIIGCPRSGTTFFASLLELTDYGRPFETHFIPKYYKRLDRYGDLRIKNNARRLLRDILAERPVQQWKLNVDVDAFLCERGNMSYAELAREVCTLHARQKGKSTWGDKTPRYKRDLPIIHALYPDAKYIYLYRDGRDVALSLLRKPWGPNNVWGCASVWARYNTDTPLVSELETDGRLIKLKYEDLLTNIDSEMRRVYQFLDQTFDPEAIDAFTSQVRPGNFNKWKTQFTPSQLRVFEGVAGEVLRKLNYETLGESVQLSRLERASYGLHNLVTRAWFLFRLNVIDGIRIRYFGKAPFPGPG